MIHVTENNTFGLHGFFIYTNVSSTFCLYQVLMIILNTFITYLIMISISISIKIYKKNNLTISKVKMHHILV